MFLAISVALSISLDAHVVILAFQKNTSSAALQPNRVASSSKYFAFVTSNTSLSGKNQVTHRAQPLDIILTL
jgi:hypothetical protein